MNPVYPKYYHGWICVAAWSHILGSSQSCAPSLFPVQTLMRSSGLRPKCPGSTCQHEMYLRCPAGVYMVSLSSKHHFCSLSFPTQLTETMFKGAFREVIP